MPIRLCLQPGCPNPATYRGRCPTHSQHHNKATHHNRHIYNSARWKYLRRAVLLNQPICRHCNNKLATDVDHITPINNGGNPYDQANCQALCAQCHGRKTRTEQA